MTSLNEPTAETIRLMAEQAGLPPLPADEAEPLLRGVRRNRAMAQNVRGWVARETEPALTFDAGPAAKKE